MSAEDIVVKRLESRLQELEEVYNDTLNELAECTRKRVQEVEDLVGALKLLYNTPQPRSSFDAFNGEWSETFDTESKAFWTARRKAKEALEDYGAVKVRKRGH